MPAFKAEPQVYPRVSRFQAVLTAIRAGRDLLYLVKMCTLHCHNVLPAVKDVMPYHIHTKHCNVAIIELSKKNQINSAVAAGSFLWYSIENLLRPYLL